MGYHKDRLIEEDDQGWKHTGKNICGRCLCDPYLRCIVREKARYDDCSFCGRIGRTKPIAIPFDDIMEVIRRTIDQYWDFAENEAIAWDQEDGEYVGSTYDTWDLVHEEIHTPSENEDVIQEIVDSLGDHIWCDKNPYAITGVERYVYSWEEFCKTVKHKARYFFESMPTSEFSEKIPGPELLDELRDIIDAAGLITDVRTGTPFYRIRAHGREQVCDSWRLLGSPPPDKCLSNRMSAAGISVFYAGFDLATARSETMANLDPGDRRIFTAGTWTNTRALNVLDLTRLPPIPGFYAEYRYNRDYLVFLRNFVKEISQPVAHDGREHIDYVPTQILTGYLRYRYRFGDNRTLDGIIYPSAQRQGGRSVVVFAAQNDLDPDENHDLAPCAPILTLDPTSIRRVRKPRR